MPNFPVEVLLYENAAGWVTSTNLLPVSHKFVFEQIVSRRLKEMGFSNQTASTQSAFSNGSGSKVSKSSSESKMTHMEIDELLAAEHLKKSSPCTADMFYAIMNGEKTGEEQAVSAAYALMNGESVVEKPVMTLDEDVFDLTPLTTSLHSPTGSNSNMQHDTSTDCLSVVSDLTEDSATRRKRRQRRGSTGRTRRRGSSGSNGSRALVSPTGRRHSIASPGDQARKLISVVQDSFGDFAPTEDLIGLPSPMPEVCSSSRHEESSRCMSVTSGASTEFRAANSDDGEKGVHFGHVRVRYYERIIDINPGVSSGIALGIGWKYNKSRRLKLEEYELQRGGVRYKAQQLVLPRHIREDIAKQFGYTQKDIAEGTRLNLRYKNERKQTIDNLNLSGVEEKLESATRKVVKMISFGTKRRM
eukprot:scaffold3070_cov128-Cylindrotheca_fusiformis.AAC.3